MSSSSRICVLAAACILGPAAQAQWTNSPASANVLAAVPGEQNQAKIRPTQDGGCYVSWFDNRIGGYDVYLQRLDWRGVPQWAPNGLLIADRGFSSTVDYDLTVDAAGNALVTFNDDRPGSNQITVNKVDPAGNMLFGPLGIVVTTGTGGKNNPKVAALSDGNIMIGWSESPGFKLQKLDPNGLFLGGILTVSEAGRTVTLSDMKASDNASVICLWIRPFNTNFQSSKYLYAQKYDAALLPQWPVTPGSAAVVVYGPTGSPYGSQGGSVQNGYFPTFVSDDHGGAVFGWYENAGPRNAYIQHVLADGRQKFALNGVPNTVSGGTRMRISAALAYNRWRGEYFLSSTESQVSPQGNYGVIVQKYDDAGVIQWGSGGTNIVDPAPTGQPSFVGCDLNGDGCTVIGENITGTTGIIFGGGVDSNGTVLWGNPLPVLMDSVIDGKARLTTSNSFAGFTMGAWASGPSGNNDMWSNRLNFDGSMGNGVNEVSGQIALADWTATLLGVPVTLEIVSGTTTIETKHVQLTLAGGYRFDTNLSGAYDVYARGPHWLRKNLGSFILGGVSSGVSGMLTNGDIDGDNEVAIGDYAVLSSAFGTIPVSVGWVENADLNGDESVDIGDYAVLSANFGLVGD